MSPNLLAEVDGPAVIQALGTALGMLLSAWFGYRLSRPKVMAEAGAVESKAQQEMTTRQRAEERKERKDMMAEKDEMIDALQAALKDARAEVHEARDSDNAKTVENAELKIKLRFCEQANAERDWQIAQLYKAVNEAGLRVNLHRPPPEGGGR
jgi:esterase/lipase